MFYRVLTEEGESRDTDFVGEMESAVIGWVDYRRFPGMMVGLGWLGVPIR